MEKSTICGAQAPAHLSSNVLSESLDNTGPTSTRHQRALVTGCAGFIGSHLTESLLEDGCEVVGVDCFNGNYARNEKLRNLERARNWSNFDFVPVDLARGDLHEFVADCDVIFHLAAEPGVRASWGERFETYVRNNVLATQHLLDAAKDHPGKRLVYASSSSIYGQAEQFPTNEEVLPRPMSPYGVTKLTAEHLCAAYQANHGVDAVTLRFFSVYGPRQRPDMAFSIFCTAILEGKSISVFGTGEQTRDFTYVSDVVAATRRAASTADIGGRVYNIGGGAQIGLNDAITALEELSGKQLEVQREARQHGDVLDTCADSTRARSELSLQRMTDFATGLAHQFHWAQRERGKRNPTVRAA